MKPEAFIFDFGGVIFDWDPRYLYRKFFDGDTEAMERFLVEIDFFQWNLQQDEGRPFAEAVSQLSERFPQYTELIRAYRERWEESIQGPIQPTLDILSRLKRAGYPLYALSNWSAETYQLIRPRYDFFDWFDCILVSGEARVAKPDPRIYTLFLEKIHRKAEECLFIDDSESNVQAAQQLGFQVVRFESPAQLEAELRQMGLLQ
jgi:2-haloacid dehalogenase